MNSKKRTITLTVLIMAILLGLVLRKTPSILFDDSNLLRRSQKDGPANSAILRYKLESDPVFSRRAAEAYYARREELIRGFHGDAQIDSVIPNIKSGENLIRWIGKAQRQETIQAIPLIVELLNHGDDGVCRVAAETLCWFRDKRGFDYVMNQMEGGDSQSWLAIFQEDFARQKPVEYLPRLKQLVLKKRDAGSRVEVYVIAQVLAQLGDAESVKYLLPVIERRPHMSIDAILNLANVTDPSVTNLMQKLSKEGSTNEVKHAADVVLAKQGDVSAQKRLIDAASRVSGLPQPQNADGSYKPGLKPEFFGQATPAWDGNAVFALEHGMEVVDPAQAVPVLRDIAIHADNVHFSATAIKLLAKIGDESARNALWDVARSVQALKRTDESTLFTPTAKALMLFADETSASLATVMFSGDHHGREVCQFLAETRGWEGLFKLELFY
jgi:HEAT repeat protein